MDDGTAGAGRLPRTKRDVGDPVDDHQIALVWLSIIAFVLALPMPVSTVPFVGDAPLRGYEALFLAAPAWDEKAPRETAREWVPRMLSKGWAESQRSSLLWMPWCANPLLAAVWICGFRRWPLAMSICGCAALALGLSAFYFFAKFPFEIGFGAWIVSLTFAFLAGMVTPVTWLGCFLASPFVRLAQWVSSEP